MTKLVLGSVLILSALTAVPSWATDGGERGAVSKFTRMEGVKLALDTPTARGRIRSDVKRPALSTKRIPKQPDPTQGRPSMEGSNRQDPSIPTPPGDQSRPPGSQPGGRPGRLPAQQPLVR